MTYKMGSGLNIYSKFSFFFVFNKNNTKELLSSLNPIIVGYIFRAELSISLLHLKNFHKIFSEHTLGNCNKFYFTFVIGIQNRDRIYWIFKRKQITICLLFNKSNLNTKRPNILKFTKYKQIFTKGLKIVHQTIHNFL